MLFFIFSIRFFFCCMDIITKMLHILNFGQTHHQNVTLHEVWMRNGRTILGCPNLFRISAHGFVGDNHMFKALCITIDWSEML